MLADLKNFETPLYGGGTNIKSYIGSGSRKNPILNHQNKKVSSIFSEDGSNTQLSKNIYDENKNGLGAKYLTKAMVDKKLDKTLSLF